MAIKANASKLEIPARVLYPCRISELDLTHMPFDRPLDPSDSTLLVRYAAGDNTAAATLMARLTPAVLGMAYRILNDRAEAEDVVQEAMIRLWRIAPDWDPGRAQVSTWLYKVALNLCRDRLRARRTVGMPDGFDVADDAPSAAQGLLEQARVDALQAALTTLSDRQRQAVVLRHIEGLANPEIAEIMGVSVEAVESLSARGKRALAVALADHREALGFTDD